jgi:hypothetical protein
LINVTIPGTVANIENSAFNGCGSLSHTTIPGSVTNIGQWAFQNCHSLTSVFFAGNAPTADSTGFSGDKNTTAYYSAGTTGWDVFSTNTGIPAVLWNPLVQAGGENFGVQNDRFGFDITGTPNIPIAVQACSDLAGGGWSALQSMTLTNGSVHFSETMQTTNSCRFYRINPP